MGLIFLAQRINQLMGGAAVMPWEVRLLPDEYLMAFEGLIYDLPEASKGYRELDAAFERVTKKFEQRH